MATEQIAQRILRYIQKRGYQPQPADELAEAIGIGAEEMGDFHGACRALMRAGRVVSGSHNALVLPPPPGKITGVFRGNPRGFGFIIPSTPNAHGDLYVPPEAAGGAVTGDTVRAKVVKRGKRGGKMLYEARVLGIVQRGQSRIVGELHRQFGNTLVIPDGNTLHVPVLVEDAGAKGARPGDQVVVEITEYPQDRAPAEGVIVKVLGPRGEPGVETLSIIEQYQLRTDFPEDALQEARDAVAAYEPRTETGDREDLTKLTTITIDPADARDFDDAISLSRDRSGTWELGVHIADVSHFVGEGGALDQEATERSNSVYLPRTVLPMLPEVLSNGVCSLQEGRPRLTKSVFIRYDNRGAIKGARFANTVIQSTKRLTYEQAARILDRKKGRVSAKVVALLKDMEKLARAIQKRRLRAGALELDLPEVELVHDDDGRAIDVKPVDTSFPHKIIEMFMVEANEAVARLLDELKVPFLRRTHDDPKDLSDGSLQRFLKALGHDLPRKPDRFDLQRVVDAVRGRPEAFAVHLAVLRSMSQAEYSPLPIGHYALASTHYCHFTSPIRRYPDLTVHRLLDRYLRGELAEGRIPDDLPTEEELFELGGKCSANERRAESAEHELKEVLILRMLEAHVGEEFDGIVTGVANIGLFVQIERYLIDGLLRFDQLPDDWWEVDTARWSIVGQRTGKRMKVGDRIKVAIRRVLIPTRQLDLTVPASERAEEDRPTRRRPKRPRGPNKTGKRRTKKSIRKRPTKRPRARRR